MWQCSPTRRSPRLASTLAIASSAAPEASEKPNFWSSTPVAMALWVCASTPGVTRISTDCGKVTNSASASISSSESTTMRPTR